MMKYSLALIAYLATVSLKGAEAMPLSDLISEITAECPDIASALASPDFSTLSSLISTAGSTEITLPEGKKEIIVAPTNAAFEKLLGKLGLTSEELINSELFVPTLATHIAVASNNGASQADTVAGSKIRMYAGIDTVDKLALSSIPIGVVDTSATVQGPMNKGIVSRTINCNDGKYVLVSDSVLEPKEINGAVPPATSDVIVPEPTMMPEEITTPATPVDIPTVTASPEMMSPEMMTPEVMTPEVVVPSTVNATVVEASPEPMPQAPPSPAPVLPVIATDSATGLKAVVASAVAVVAAALM